MWAPAYATAGELADWLGVDPDPELAAATEAASRVIDKHTGRQFGLLSSSEFRWYTAEFWKDRWLIKIDDLMTEQSLTIEVDNDQDGVPEAEITMYRLTPINAAPDRPWTEIEVLPASPVKPNGIRHGVRISARWGWTTVPEPIKLATLIQSARFYERRDNPAGPLSQQRIDDIDYRWNPTASLDDDVLAIVAPFRRYWGVA